MTKTRAEVRRLSAIENVIERLDVIEALGHYPDLAARRRQAEQIVDAVWAIRHGDDNGAT